MITAALDDKIKKFQKDNDLKVDGYLQPGGETQNAINRQLQLAPESPPDYRREVFKGKRFKEWDDFYREVENDSTLSGDEHRILQDIYAAEGGMKKAPGGTAFAGIIQETLDNLIAKEKLPNIVEKHADKKKIQSTDLDMKDIRDFYVAYFDDALSSAKKGYKRRNPDNPKSGLRLLADLGNHVGDSVADTLFKNGGDLGVKVVQDALNEYRPVKGYISDKAIGSNNYNTLKEIASDKKEAKKFLDKLAFQRIQQEKNAKNEKERVYRYLKQFKE